MLTDIGEFIVGAHLKLIKKCDFIDYNVRPPGGGLKGLGEFHVVALNFNSNTAYLCGVTTHIRSVLYKSEHPVAFPPAESLFGMIPVLLPGDNRS